MASSTTSTVETEEVYFAKRAEVQLQIKNNEIKAVDLYSLAPLLARWRSNDTFPVCLLCQISVPEGEFGLGHLIPNSRGRSRIFRTSVKFFWRTGRYRRWAWWGEWALKMF
jgi:hypothetical protein